MNQCPHYFVEFNTSIRTGISRRLVCAYCGHIREVFENGEIVVKQQIGNVKHEQSNSTIKVTGPNDRS